MGITENLRELTKKSGMTQQQLAQRLGISRITLNRFFNNKTKPGYDLVLKLLDLHGVNVEGMLQEKLHPQVLSSSTPSDVRETI